MQKEVYEFISQQNADPIIERRTCKWTGKLFPIFESEKRLLEKISPTIGGKKYLLDLPKISPEVRQIKRQAFRNERSFYKFTDKKGKTSISTIAPDMGLNVMNLEDFREEDMMKYGIEYTGDVFSDLQKLFSNTPYPSKLTSNMENAEYCNQETDDKNCYLNAGGHFNENSLYNTYSLRSKWTVDNYWIWDSEQIYRSIYTFKSQNVFFGNNIENSYNIRFGEDIKGSQNVLFGYGLRNANYVYKNQVVSKQEREDIFHTYKEKMKSYTGLQEIQKEYVSFIAQFPRKSLNNSNIENCIGNYLTNSQDCILCTAGEDNRDVMHSNIIAGVQDALDIESMGRGSKIYNSSSLMNATNGVAISHILDTSSNIMYTSMSQNIQHIIASFGLKHKQYCVLNKQYTKEEYEKIVVQMIEDLQKAGRFGDFFDPIMSPFPYNDSVAYEYYPIDESQLVIHEPEKFISDATLDLGGEEKIPIKRRTRHQEINVPEGIDTIQGAELPENIDDVDDSILQKAIICTETGRPFRCMSMELSFHRRHGIPLRRVHPDVRHRQKIKMKPPRKFCVRHCNQCNKDILSVYQHGFEGKVYCESCFDKTIY